MRYKPGPEPRPLADVGEIQAAVPLVPGSVDDCCLRLQQRAGVPDRSAAREWLPFLVALGLAGERDGSYYRKRVDPDRESLARNFRERVYGVTELLDVVGERDGATPAEAFGATADLVPTWERNRESDWEESWRDRTRRVLEWGVVLDILSDEDGRYTL
jgi:hypothetical protein